MWTAWGWGCMISLLVQLPFVFDGCVCIFWIFSIFDYFVQSWQRCRFPFWFTSANWRCNKIQKIQTTQQFCFCMSANRKYIIHITWHLTKYLIQKHQYFEIVFFSHKCIDFVLNKFKRQWKMKNEHLQQRCFTQILKYRKTRLSAVETPQARFLYPRTAPFSALLSLLPP